MITTIFIILWLLIGFSSITFSANAWFVSWYEQFNEHYVDTEYYSFKEEFIITFILTLSGIFSFIVISTDGGFDSKSEYYFPKSLWMIFYNKEKVEKHFNKLKQNK